MVWNLRNGKIDTIAGLQKAMSDSSSSESQDEFTKQSVENERKKKLVKKKKEARERGEVVEDVDNELKEEEPEDTRSFRELVPF